METVVTVLRLAVVCSLLRVASYVEGALQLPSGACYWRQGSLINSIPTGATEDLTQCRFVVRDLAFLDILGRSPKLVELVKTNAHEGGVWYPDRNELYFTSGRLTGPDGEATAEGFRTAPKVNNQVYRISASGVVDAVADGFTQPNGLAFSHDEKRLYVSDSGFATGISGQFDIDRPHSITVFDIGSDRFLFNRRLFASVGVYDGSSPGLGIPDGIKVDTKERVYVATVDGIQVFSKSGKPLGLIRQPGTSNMGFAGKGLGTLYLLNDTTIYYVTLQVEAAGLKYARTAEHHIH